MQGLYVYSLDLTSTMSRIRVPPYVTEGKDGSFRVSQAQLDSDAYTPATVMAGEFVIFAKTARVTITAANTAIERNDFAGKYQLTSGRKLSVLEETLVPTLEDWYIIPESL